MLRKAPATRLVSSPSSACCGRRVAPLRRYMEESTKNNKHMKHLDLYARRDPQLAPYLLREVDIEWKRKCRKVNFVFWVAVAVGLMLYDQRLAAEAIYFLKQYAVLMADEQEARDFDADMRRAKLVGVMGVVKDAYRRNAKWTKADENAAVEILTAATPDPSMRATPQ
jgi:hypothetical protein